MNIRTYLVSSLFFSSLPLAGAQVFSPDGSFPPTGAKEVELHKLFGGLSHGTEFVINSLTLDDMTGSARLRPGFSGEVVTSGHAHLDISAAGTPEFLDGDFSQDLQVDYLSTDATGLDTYNIQVRKFKVGCGPTVVITLSPDQAGTGIVTVGEWSKGGAFTQSPSGFAVTSSFDVFTGVSLDGGLNYGATNGPATFQLQGVPEPASLSALGFAAIGLLKRKRVR